MIMYLSKCVRVNVVILSLGSPSRYTAAVILNSTYDYDPVSRKDDLVDMVASTLNIIVPAMRPDIAVIVDAFPLRESESNTFPVSRLITRQICFKFSVFRRGYPVCPLRGRWRLQTRFRSSISNDRLSTLFKKW